MLLPVVVASVAATGSAIATSAPATTTLETIVTTTVPSLVASALPSVTTTIPVTETPLVLPPVFEVVAVFAGALSGALLGVNRKFDITGVVVLALVAGLGGGLMRDVLLQNMGIFAFESSRALFAVLVAALTAAFFYTAAAQIKRFALIVDTASLALFAIVGADKGLRAGLLILPAMLVGVITAVGGGVIRDILIGTVPQVMKRGSLTATAAAAGSAIYVLMVGWLDFEKSIALLFAGGIAFVLRAGSLYFGWRSPAPVDLTPAVVDAPRKVIRGGHRYFRRLGRGAKADTGRPERGPGGDDVEIQGHGR
jgi:uncharacterized membrane protein YeiH